MADSPGPAAAAESCRGAWDADGPPDAEAAALPRGVAEALADPIVQVLMAADRIDPESMAALMRRAAGRLQNRVASA